MVRKGGFEPPRLSAPPPQDGVSASSTTSADVFDVTPSQTIIIAGASWPTFLHPESSPFHNGGKGLGVEARAAHQASVNFFLRHQRLGIFRLDASAVQDAQLLSCVLSQGH